MDIRHRPLIFYLLNSIKHTNSNEKLTVNPTPEPG